MLQEWANLMVDAWGGGQTYVRDADAGRTLSCRC